MAASPSLGNDRDPPAPLMSVVVVVYNSGPSLERCLDALEAQTFTDFETLLIDNASPDGAAQAAAKTRPWVRLIEAGENLGFAAGNNLAARQARGRWLVLLNPDAYAAPDWLEKLHAAAVARPDVRSFTSRQLMDEDPGRLDGLGDCMFGAGIPFRGGYGTPDPGHLAPGYVFSPCGAAMMIDRDLFLDLGGFDERYFCYCEDVDFGYRLLLERERTLVVPDAVVRHAGSLSSGGPKSEFAVFHGTRNRLWLLVKDTPWPLLPFVLPLHFLTVAAIATRPLGRLQAATTWRALKAAFTGLGPVWRDRAAVQRRRKASWWAVAWAMTWNLNDVRKMRVVIRR